MWLLDTEAIPICGSRHPGRVEKENFVTAGIFSICFFSRGGLVRTGVLSKHMGFTVNERQPGSRRIPALGSAAQPSGSSVDVTGYKVKRLKYDERVAALFSRLILKNYMTY